MAGKFRENGKVTGNGRGDLRVPRRTRFSATNGSVEFFFYIFISRKKIFVTPGTRKKQPHVVSFILIAAIFTGVFAVNSELLARARAPCPAVVGQKTVGVPSVFAPPTA